jgi:hypothetical protein
MAVAAWLAVDLAHAWWHHAYEGLGGIDLATEAMQSVALATLLTVAVSAKRWQRVRVPLLCLVGVYGVVRGLSGTFFTDEAAWIHVVLGLMGIVLLIVAVVVHRAHDAPGQPQRGGHRAADRRGGRAPRARRAGSTAARRLDRRRVIDPRRRAALGADVDAIAVLRHGGVEVVGRSVRDVFVASRP